ncbi:MAG TPA: class I SAM-dependent methyltransferase [Thermoanaerobaculia bacterium]|nr:class I SAM-dependent methyltransferase [Thermoanaerobaculia bacterium]
MARLLEDRPLFHGIDEADVRHLAAQGISFPGGDCSWNVGPPILHRIAARLTGEMVSIETGAGYTTVLMAAVVSHHHSCTAASREEERIRRYLQEIGVPQEKVTFHIGSSADTLPRLELDVPLDFAYIDGCHGYPVPALDWHYIDQRLRVGGIVGMDDVDLRPVRDHCAFLDENGSYELVEAVNDQGNARFYRKLKDENREWVCQPYSRAGNAWLEPYLLKDRSEE